MNCIGHPCVDLAHPRMRAFDAGIARGFLDGALELRLDVVVVAHVEHAQQHQQQHRRHQREFDQGGTPAIDEKIARPRHRLTRKSLMLSAIAANEALSSAASAASK
ncbi:hypothetical protein D2V04_04910 [Pelagerythrobacter aerophilus]|uniref:Uncharacterized protein n=1 Tax=Pelagerythrobacter aerophilus TaxID=2306995 RepID=A0A418NJ38_9SPHN|nr:hypothetical protein D2V04_04910 [Pelagerythrobacter aerophilus]